MKENNLETILRLSQLAFMNRLSTLDIL